MEQGVVDSERPYDNYLKEEGVVYYDIPALITNSDSYLVVVEVNGEIAGSGYAQIRQSRPFHTHDFHCYLGFIYLESRCRGKAIGRQIIDALKDWGISKGMKNIQLKVYAENAGAIRAYKKSGFNEVSVLMELVV